MIDEGECDWKVVAIDLDDKWAPYLDDINDVEELLPGTLEAIREWFRTYKIPDGKPPNVFGLGERFMNKDYAGEVINECHHAWEQLITGEKHRHLDKHGDEVRDLVRNLSRHSLFTLGDDLDEHPEAHGSDFGDEDSGAMFF
jgi:inorganic pyrophosphatase